MEKPAAPAPLALEDDCVIIRNGPNDGTVSDRAGRIAENGEVADTGNTNGLVAVVFKDLLDVFAADPMLPAQEDPTVAVRGRFRPLETNELLGQVGRLD